MSKEKGKTMVC